MPEQKSKDRITLSREQKLAALAARFYQGLKWMVSVGDYYTSSRADLELYRVVEIDGDRISTEYCAQPGQLAEWDLWTFTTEGFGLHRVWVPEWIFQIPNAAPEPCADYAAVYEAFSIGTAVRTPQTLLANIENARRRGGCLDAIEREFFTHTSKDDDGEEFDDCAMTWGAEPALYVEQFRAALAQRTANQPRAVAADLVLSWALQIEAAYCDLPASEYPGPPTDLVRRMRQAAGSSLTNEGLRLR